MSDRLLITGARVVTPAPLSTARGPVSYALEVVPDADVLIENGMIASVSERSTQREALRPLPRTIFASGRVLAPGFVDAHTHALWAGDRLDEWDRKRDGASYLDILKSGGGIMSTVRAVRAASQRELEESLRARLSVMLREGTTTVEVKSGYGLTTEDELKMLRAIASRAADPSPTVVATALIGHALDPDVPSERFIRRTIDETLPAVHAEFPGVAIDAYCEKGAWPLEACIELFTKAIDLGHPVRMHADQFNALGMTEWAASHGARSVDHLEACPPETLRAVAKSDAFAVLLPCAGFHVDGRYANGRALVDAGARVVLATNCNPGSAPTSSMPMAVALGVRHCGLSPAEAITSCTRNAAALLGFTDRGVITPGMRADLVLLRHTDERLLAYEFGGNPVDTVLAAGRVV